VTASFLADNSAKYLRISRRCCRQEPEALPLKTNSFANAKAPAKASNVANRAALMQPAAGAEYEEVADPEMPSIPVQRRISHCPNGGEDMPHGKKLRGASSMEQRQYEHIKEKAQNPASTEKGRKKSLL
jgi:hypothetical protein